MEHAYELPIKATESYTGPLFIEIFKSTNTLIQFTFQRGVSFLWMGGKDWRIQNKRFRILLRISFQFLNCFFHCLI